MKHVDEINTKRFDYEINVDTTAAVKAMQRLADETKKAADEMKALKSLMPTRKWWQFWK